MFLLEKFDIRSSYPKGFPQSLWVTAAFWGMTSGALGRMHGAGPGLGIELETQFLVLAVDRDAAQQAGI